MRFTLKTLMAATLVAAILCCIFFTLPGWLAIVVLGFFWMLAPPALIAGIVYGRGYGRAFSIGCVSAGGCMPVLWLYSLAIVADGSGLSLSMDDESAAGMKIAFGLLFMLAGLSGLTSMIVRWASLRMQSRKELPSESPAYSVLQSRVTTVPTTLVASVGKTLESNPGETTDVGSDRK
jgi:hypothetical protein